MNAQSLSSQYELPAIADTDVPNTSGVRFDGDFAAGLRALEPDAGGRGDFATGMTSTTRLVMTTGDFATGLRTDPAAEFARGDFATGQRTGRSDTPNRGGQLARRGRSPVWLSPATVATKAP
jgi:hypothetical protein